MSLTTVTKPVKTSTTKLRYPKVDRTKDQIYELSLQKQIDRFRELERAKSNDTTRT